MVNIVAISDTHLHGFPDLSEIKGDILIHAGDGLNSGSFSDWCQFKGQLVKYRNNFTHCLYVPGNHDFYVEENEGLCKDELWLNYKIKLLSDTYIELEGLKIYGTPWMPRFYDWAYMRTEENLESIYNRIPEGLDILITHGPPDGILDLNKLRNCCGSKSLNKAVFEKKPKTHIFGHIHPTLQSDRHINISGIEFYNVAIMNEMYDPEWESTVLEL